MSDPLPENLKKLDALLKEAGVRIFSAKTTQELNELKLRYAAGKKSLQKELGSAIQQLPLDLKKKFGPKVNRAIETIEKWLQKAEADLHNLADQVEPSFDVTLPVPRAFIGHLSPDREVIRRLNEFFNYYGYSVAEGPEIETDEYNFEKTNLPKNHPARDLQDTIYLSSPEILLRTHTSSVETRLLSRYKPPLRFVVPGVSFRNEIINQSNHAIFYQYQGVLVDKNVGLGQLKATLEELARFMYGPHVKTRLRTKYYPEVEPGVGLDVLCSFCRGRGCGICKGRGWLEILGSGIIHRELLRKCGIDYRKWSGFAFGLGLDRLIMTRFGIDDIRKLHNGELVIVD